MTALNDYALSDTKGRPVMVTTFGSGEIYTKTDTASADTARRFETTAKRLRDAWIQVATNTTLFGDSSGQTYSVADGGYFYLRGVDISSLYFKNATPGSNGVVRIIGTLE
jgi:hypothetical protein